MGPLVRWSVQNVFVKLYDMTMFTDYDHLTHSFPLLMLHDFFSAGQEPSFLVESVSGCVFLLADASMRRYF